MSVAVVVTYSAGQEVLDRCVAALRAGGGVDHIVVVDTGGRATVAGPAIELIRMGNRGYGAAANVGFAAAMGRGADRIALLNDDVIVRPGWFEQLDTALSDTTTDIDVGAAQPKLLFAGTSTINSLGVHIGPDGAGTDIGMGEADAAGIGPGDEPSDLHIFTGGAVLFSRSFLESTGGFDERYVLYYEDVDLALRGKELGWSYRLVPTSVVEHIGSLSTASAPRRTRFLQERNRLLASFRFADRRTRRSALWLSIRRLRHAPRRTHAHALCAALWMRRSW